jgi:hypothetical protein
MLGRSSKLVVSQPYCPVVDVTARRFELRPNDYGNSCPHFGHLMGTVPAVGNSSGFRGISSRCRYGLKIQFAVLVQDYLDVFAVRHLVLKLVLVDGHFNVRA